MNYKDLANYCLSCINKPCVTGCPLGNNITDFIKMMKEDKLEDAFNILIETTYLSSICGRICPHSNQCEGKCIRGLKGNPVSIGELEAFIGDLALNNNWPIKMEEEKNYHVAIIGSGPSSLSCAYHLRRNGIKVTIYEKYNSLGGIMRHSIPDFRLDKTFLDKTIDRLLNMGVDVKYNMILGENLTLFDLSQYDGVYIGIGANESKELNVHGANLDGVIGGNILLENHLDVDFNNKKVIVYGGGNVAMDVARTIKRKYNSEVSVVYRRNEYLMPADKKEVEEAKRDNINFIFQTNIVKVHGEDHINAIEVVDTSLLSTGFGKPSVVDIPDSNHMIPCDYLLVCIGSKPYKVTSSLGLLLDEDGYIKVDDNYHTSNPKVYAGGDIIKTNQTVAYAARSGIEAAKQIINDLIG
ncbi:MAG: FAD-dependent oxidoreductase [Bacilli bacterium]|nr:FAD-dependent oxidoreductase [Bacilli bacterium]